MSSFSLKLEISCQNVRRICFLSRFSLSLKERTHATASEKLKCTSLTKFLSECVVMGYPELLRALTGLEELLVYGFHGTCEM